MKSKKKEALNCIQIGDYIIDKEILGEGSYGVVRVAYLEKEKKKKFAVKIMSLVNIDDYLKKRIESEIEIMKKLKNHKSILKLYDTIRTENNYYIFTEKCDGNLSQKYLENKINLSDEEIEKNFESLISGVEAMHNKNIIHRDIKPQNILIGEKKDWKIADFGISKHFDNESTRVGTPFYFPIEILKNTKYTLKFDIW